MDKQSRKEETQVLQSTLHSPWNPNTVSTYSIYIQHTTACRILRLDLHIVWAQKPTTKHAELFLSVLFSVHTKGVFLNVPPAIKVYIGRLTRKNPFFTFTWSTKMLAVIVQFIDFNPRGINVRSTQHNYARHTPVAVVSRVFTLNQLHHSWNSCEGAVFSPWGGQKEITLPTIINATFIPRTNQQLWLKHVNTCTACIPAFQLHGVSCCAALLLSSICLFGHLRQPQ